MCIVIVQYKMKLTQMPNKKINTSKNVLCVSYILMAINIINYKYP